MASLVLPMVILLTVLRSTLFRGDLFEERCSSLLELSLAKKKKDNFDSLLSFLTRSVHRCRRREEIADLS